MSSIPDELFTYYFFECNTLIIGKNEKQSKEHSVATEGFLFHLLLRYEIKDLQKLKCYPEIIEKISTMCFKDPKAKFVAKLEQQIMNASFFEQQKFQSFQEYLASITDEALLKRIQEVAKDTETCYICFENEAKHVTSCSHSICDTCFSKLSSPICPFCRQKNITLFLKSEIEIKNVDEEEKVKEKKVTKKLTIVYDFDAFIQKRLKALFSMGTGKLSLANMTEIQKLVSHYDFKVVLDSFLNYGKFSNEELTFYFVGHLAIKLYAPKPNTKNDEEAKKKVEQLLTKYLKSPNKILRFLSVLKGEPAETSKPVEMKLNKFYKKLLIKIINSFEITSEVCGEFQQHESIWQKIFKNFKVMKEKKLKTEKYSTITTFANCVFGNIKYPCKSNQFILDDLIQNKDIKIFDFFKKEPGLFFRNALRICSEYKFDDISVFGKFLEFILPRMKFEQLIELKNVLTSYNNERHFFTKFGTFYFTDDKVEKKFQEFNENHKLLLDEILMSLFSKIDKDAKKDDKICILDAKLKEIHIPKGKIQEPILNLNKIPANRGDKYYFDKDIALKDDCEVVFFIYWKNGSERVDLDLSVFGLDSSFEYRNKLCDFTRLEGFSGTMRHSGDITDAPNGASEFVRFNIPSLKKSNTDTKYIVLSTLSFNSIAFENMGDAHVGIGYKSKDLKGDGPYQSVVIDSCRLSGNAKMNLGAFIDLDELSITFMNMNIPSKKGSISVSGNSKLLSTCVQKFNSWMNSRSLPSNWFDISLLYSSSLSTVYLIDEDSKDDKMDVENQEKSTKVLEFKKKKDEKSFDFYHRILNKEKDAELLLKDVELKEDNLYYFGDTGITGVQLPKKSTHLSTSLTVEDETITLLDHPFKLFHLVDDEKK